MAGSAKASFNLYLSLSLGHADAKNRRHRPGGRIDLGGGQPHRGDVLITLVCTHCGDRPRGILHPIAIEPADVAKICVGTQYVELEPDPRPGCETRLGEGWSQPRKRP